MTHYSGTFLVFHNWLSFTFILLMWTFGWAPNNASKWEMGSLKAWKPCGVWQFLDYSHVFSFMTSVHAVGVHHRPLLSGPNHWCVAGQYSSHDHTIYITESHVVVFILCNTLVLCLAGHLTSTGYTQLQNVRIFSYIYISLQYLFTHLCALFLASYSAIFNCY
jgi:hypothetical protein